MKIELANNELQETITALSHWRTYLIMEGRDDSMVKAVLDNATATKRR